MQNQESQYVPVVQVVVGVVGGVLFSRLVMTDLGAWSYLVFTFATLGAFSVFRDGWSTFNQLRLWRRNTVAYDKVVLIHKPKIMNPAKPGNLDYMAEEAQKAVDDATVLMDRLGIRHPPNIDIRDSASVEAWYEHLRPLRRQAY